MSGHVPKYRLTAGKHRRVDHETGETELIRKGEPFVPTDQEKRQNEERLERARGPMVTVPRVPWLEE